MLLKKGNTPGPNTNVIVRHRVFADVAHCEGDDYTAFETPFGQCYNIGAYDGQEQYDILDEISEWEWNGRPTMFRRTYYSSMDGSCQDPIEGRNGESWYWGSMCSSSWADDGSASSKQQTLIFGR